ncbi:MAG: DUF1294 domain-containing protein [Bacteroidaceae bacterium]|nr:DUF1294 domain-containing protein [Bacteroidaceae bacterium]
MIYYLTAISIVTFVLYGIDKYKAKKGKWRISEKSLLLMTFIGGGIGAWAGMKVWHHKTRHMKFRYGVPLMASMQLLAAIYLYLPA